MLERQHREQIAFWILLVILVAVFLKLLVPFYTPILLALVAALACQPLYSRLLHLLKGKRHLSALACLIVVTFFVALPTAFIATLLAEQVKEAALMVINGLQGMSLQEWMEQGALVHIQNFLGTWIDVDQQLLPWLQGALKNLAVSIYQHSPQVLAGTTGFIFSGMLAIIFTYFLLVDGPALYHEILHLSPLKEDYEQNLAREIQVTFYACIYGYLLTALVQAILAAIGFWIIGMHVALLLGLATFLMAFIPFVGTAGVWVPFFIYLLATGQYGKATFLGIFGVLVISGIDNVLKPILIQGKTRIHPVVLFIAILGGLRLWGPIGILAGPTLVAVLLATLKIYKQDFLTS